MKIEGLWLPIITPFKNNEIDYVSYKRLIDYYIDKGISGLIPLGTTGESPTISEEEYENILEKTMEYAKNRVPVYVGLGGNNTSKVVKQLKLVEKHKVDGILSVCPYYNRPDPKGIYQHFKNISEATDLDIILYNIPYRTGRNIENPTIHKLAELKNIVALKDSCGDIKQSMELILNPPKDFSILTGEDILFYSTMTLGAQGGILASAHLHTEKFIELYKKIKANDHNSALIIWYEIYKMIPLLFEEPNPTPIKYCLHRLGLISSPEARLPLTEISNTLENKLNTIIKT